MGIYIKGISMPTSCDDCPMGFSVNFGILCTPTHNIVGDGEISKKQGFCPLIEIPPHGRLIDVDAPMRFEIKIDGGMNMCVTDIYAPTVIEAEGGDAQ